MPEIYKNGRNYGGGGTILPSGGLTGQALLKKSNLDADFEWGDIKGITFTYVVGQTPLASDWLSLTDAGTALTPEEGMVYLIVSEGEYYNNFVRWDDTNRVYIVISSGASLLTGTLLANVWSNKMQSVTVTGIKSTTTGIIGLLNTSTKAQFDAACEAGIRVTTVATNTISFECEEVPDINIPFGVIVGLGGGSGSGSGGADNFVKGYFYNDAFYEDQAHQTVLDSEENVLYLDIPSEKCYEFDGAHFNRIDDEEIQKSSLPVASASLLGTIYQYIGVTGGGLTHGFFYECVSDGGSTPVYSWDVLDVMQGGHVIKNAAGSNMAKRKNLQFKGGATVSDDSSSDSTIVETEQVQFSTLPSPSQDLLGKIVQFIGASSGSLVQGHFYKCIEDPQTAGTYIWDVQAVQDNSIRTIQDAGTPVANRGNLDFYDFDITDEQADDKTKIAPHLLTPTDLNDIFMASPDALITETGSPVQYANPRWLRFSTHNHKSLVIKAGTRIKKSDGSYQFYDSDRTIDFSSTTLTPGKDYFVNLADDGTITCALTKLSTGVTIGRFHTLCVNAGTMNMIMPVSPNSGLTTSDFVNVKSYVQSDDPDFYAFYRKQVVSVSAGTPYDVVTVGHPLSGYLAGDILPESVFCLSFQPDCLFEDAMVYDKNTDIFVDVYLQSGTGLNTRSAYGETHTVSRQHLNHMGDMLAVGKQLLSDEEFTSIALGSNECSSLQSAADKTTVGGHVDSNNRRMISAIGCEECCGYLWQWLNDLGFNGGSTFKTTDGKGSFGQEYGEPHGIQAGGYWSNSSSSGSRARAVSEVRSSALVSSGCRGCTTLKQYQQASSPVTVYNPADCYSLEEQVVGTWIDGSLIYQKTWDFGSPISIGSNSWVQVPIKMSDYNMKGAVAFISASDEYTAFDSCGVSINPADNTNVVILNTRNSVIAVRYLTIQYLKN